MFYDVQFISPTRTGFVLDQIERSETVVRVVDVQPWKFLEQKAKAAYAQVPSRSSHCRDAQRKVQQR